MHVALRLAPVFAGALALGACGAVSGAPSLAAPSLLPARTAQSSPIAHIVIVIQENRSFDNLFDCFKGTACVTRGRERVKEGSGYVDKWVKITQHALVPKGAQKQKWLTDIGHCYYSFYLAYDGGKMDGFNQEPRGICPRQWGGSAEPIGVVAYQYIIHSEIAPYWDMAEQYGLADRMFQTQGSGSFTAHQDLIRGGTIVDTSGDSMIDTPDGVPWGCDAVGKPHTNLITPALKWESEAGPFPCSDDFQVGSSSYETLANLLDNAGVGWRYYSPCYVGSPKGGSCDDDCDGAHGSCSGAFLNAFDVIYPVRYGKEWGTNVSMPQTNIFTDIENGQLQPVSWIVPSQQDSDHPGDTVDDGPSWVASVVNAVGESTYWNSTAIVVVWDDWGGLYDHVAPPGKRDQQGGPGFRVPMIVISPYVPEAEVSHTPYSFGSILRYIEDNWNLGSLGTTDATSKSIVDMFDYQQQPRAFSAIPTFQPLSHFERESPFSLPADTE